MEFPIKVALAQAVPVLPEGPGWWYEPKYDGHRTVLRRTDDTVILYARSGRVVTQHWMDLAVASMTLRPGTVLDGEAVIWRNGRIDFATAQSRAASSVTRARALAARHPALYVCWDLLQHPDPTIGDCRSRPYTERRAFLLELLTDVEPPIQATPATDDRDVAVLWYDTLREQGIEGIVCKRGGAVYPPSGQRRWLKVRHADTVDALVLWFTGPRFRPHHLVLAVGDGAGRLGCPHAWSLFSRLVSVSS
ncbi:DNA ligase [Streptomyces sp. NPDC057575]|uniref:ATP-dependent DNA ligase n=1 Tax=unclassified Streptomyces TaxID=2593676 RepID=UPI003674341D